MTKILIYTVIIKINYLHFSLTIYTFYALVYVNVCWLYKE